MYLVESEIRFISRFSDLAIKIIDFLLNDLTDTSSRVLHFLNLSVSIDNSLRADL